MLGETIGKIGQRERTLAFHVMNGGLAFHTLSEQQDMNDAKRLLESVEDLQPDPEIVNLAIQA